jgi:hypothetical protein
VILGLPVGGIFACALVLGWLGYWALFLAPQTWIVQQFKCWQSVNFDCLGPGLCLILPVILYQAGQVILRHGVDTPAVASQSLDANAPPLARFSDLSGKLLASLVIIFAAGLALWLSFESFSRHLDTLWQAVAQAKVPENCPSLDNSAGRGAWALTAAAPLFLVGVPLIHLLAKVWKRQAHWLRIAACLFAVALVTLAFRGYGYMAPHVTGRVVPEADPTAAALSVFILLAFVWLAWIRHGFYFLREYLGDVAIFVPRDENSKHFCLRQEILRLAEEKLESVFGIDLYANPQLPNYGPSEAQREVSPTVVIMAHSLGTVIAYQALCRFYERSRELDRLDRLRAPTERRQPARVASLNRRFRLFCTFGSPLDVISMAFDATNSGKPILEKINYFARGLYKCPGGPFKSCRWVNWWNFYDIVSGKVKWHAGRDEPENSWMPLRALPVVNHSSYLGAPAVLADFRSKLAQELAQPPLEPGA